MAAAQSSGAKVTEWTTRADWEIRKSEFDSMDLVEIENTTPYLGIFRYSHWGVHIGDGFIAHVTTRDAVQLSGLSLGVSAVTVSKFAPSLKQHEHLAGCAKIGLQLLAENAISHSPLDDVEPENRHLYFVRVDHILVVAGDRRFRVRNPNIPGGVYVVRKVDEFYEMIRSMNNCEFSYSTFSSNCEHFATGMRFKKQGIAFLHK